MIRVLIMITAVFASCAEPDPGVVVSRNGSGYVVSLRDCRRGMKLGVINLSVYKIQNAQKRAECELTASNGDVIFERWQYGADLRGFEMTRCVPIERGSTYEIRVGSHPVDVVGHFAVQADGEVTMLNGDCRK